MICPSCGHENRPQARFCAECGESLDSYQPTPPPYEPEVPAPTYQPPDSTVETGADAAEGPARIALFGGNGLMTVGALIVLLAFMLPWASCGNMKLSGLDVVTQSSDYGGDASSTILILVPLGALGLLALGVAGVVINLLGKPVPGGLSNLVPFLPLVAVLPGLCGCCPSCAFLYQLQTARSDPSGLGMMVQIEYGFWLAVVGLGLSFVGIAAAVAGGLIARRKTPRAGPNEF